MNRFFNDYSDILPSSESGVGLSIHHNGIVYKVRDAFGIFDMVYLYLVSSFSSAGDWMSFAQGNLVDGTDFSLSAYQSELNNVYGTPAFSHYIMATGSESIPFSIDSYRKCCDDILSNNSSDEACRGLDGSLQSYYPLHSLRDEAVGYILPASEGTFVDKDNVQITEESYTDMQEEAAQHLVFIRALRDSLKEHMYDKSGTTFLYKQDFRSGMTPDVGDSIGYARSGDLYVIDRSDLISKYTADQLPVEAKCLPVTKNPSLYNSLIDSPYDYSCGGWVTPDDVDLVPGTSPLTNGFTTTWQSLHFQDTFPQQDETFLSKTIDITGVSGFYTLNFFYKDNISMVIVYCPGDNDYLLYDRFNHMTGSAYGHKSYQINIPPNKSTLKISFQIDNYTDRDASLADVHLDNANSIYGASVTGILPEETFLTKTTNLPDLTNDFNISMCYLTLQDGQEEYTIFDIKDSNSNSLLKLDVVSASGLRLSVDNVPLGIMSAGEGVMDSINMISVSSKSVSPGVSRYILGCNNIVLSFPYTREPSSDTPSIMEILDGFEGGLAYMHIAPHFINHMALPEVI